MLYRKNFLLISIAFGFATFLYAIGYFLIPKNLPLRQLLYGQYHYPAADVLLENSPNVQPMENIQIPSAGQTAAREREIVSACGIKIATLGGYFSPETCNIRVTVSGLRCQENFPCSPKIYTITLQDNSKSHIRSAEFVVASREGQQTYGVNHVTREFTGNLIDNFSNPRDLVRGTITLGTSNNEESTHIVLDVTFAGDISMQASGNISTVYEYAP